MPIKLRQKHKVYIVNQGIPIMKKNNLKTTTIKISERTRERLEHLKEHKEESADTIVNKALNLLNICSKNPQLASKLLADMEQSKKRKLLLDNPETVLRTKRQTNSNPNPNSISNQSSNSSSNRNSIQRNIQGNLNKMRSNLN